MLVSGEIVTGTHWPEAVEIIKCQPLCDGFYLVESRGLETNQYYQLLLEGDRLKQIGLKPKRLEQRMGRIHLIGQKNDVFVISCLQYTGR